MAVLTSLVGKVLIGTDKVGHLIKWSIDPKQAVGDITAIGDAWKSQVGLLASWTGSIEVNYDSTDTAQAALRNQFIAGTPNNVIPAIDFYEDDVSYYSGAVLITGWNQAKSLNAVDKVTISFDGQGALVHHNS